MTALQARQRVAGWSGGAMEAAQASQAAQFRALGALEVQCGGRLLDLGGAKQRALLAVLLVRLNQVVPADTLIEALWGERPPAGAAGTLQSYVSRLRRVLAEADAWPTSPRLLGRRPGYVLQAAPQTVDLYRFEQLVARARAAAGRDPEQAAGCFGQALALWRGPALADVAEQGLLQGEAARLQELRLAVTEELIDLELAQGRHARVVGDLERLLADHPLRERMWSQLMLALYRCGRQADALQAYQSLRAVLDQQLGIEPSPPLRRLQEDILRQRPQLGWTPSEPSAGQSVPVQPATSPEPGSAPAAPAARHNLPAALSSFVGRDRERKEVGKLVAAERLVTLTGAGGVGKTRLALAVAAELVEDHPDGVWLCELASLAQPSLVPKTVAAALGLREEPGRPMLATLTEHLRARRLLVVLDNCEHLVAACAALVDELLGACPDLRVLATSREPLGVPGEVAWVVPSLPTPDPDAIWTLEALTEYESVRLFLERARAARADLSLDSADAAAVARVCRRLDGVPLAIELAAARIGVLTIDQIAARLDDRFRLLTTGGRTVAARHHTLRAALDWSHDLLAADERVLLRRLAVFAGGFTLEAVEQVCSCAGLAREEVLDVLARLVAKSLVIMQPQAGGARYRLLETIRHYAADKLAAAGEQATLKARHRDFYLAMAQRAEPETQGSQAGPLLDALELDHANFRAALQWSLVTPAELESGLRLAHALFYFWEIRHHPSEGLRWMEALLACPGGDTAMRAAVARRAGNLAWTMGDLHRACPLWEEGLEVARRSGDLRQLGRALASAGNLARIQGRLADARSLFEESHATAVQVGDQSFVAESLLWLAWVAQHEARYAQARELARRCQDIGEGWFLRARVLYMLGWVEREQGNYEQAAGSFGACRELAASVGDLQFEAMALEGLGAVAAAQGRISEARSVYKEALRLVPEHAPTFLISPLSGLGELASAEGDHPTAHRLLEQALAESRRLGAVFVLAWNLNRLGAAAAARGDLDAAGTAYREALRLAHGSGMPWPLAGSLEGLAGLAVAAGLPDDAARVLAAAAALRQAVGAPLPPSARPACDRATHAARAALTEPRFAAAWAQGCEMSPDDAVQRLRPDFAGQRGLRVQRFQ